MTGLFKTTTNTLILVMLSYLAQAQSLVPFDSWAHQRVALQNVSIHFRYAGSGPPVILIHGNPQHSLTWHTIGPFLAQNYTVIAPDNRGMGASTIPTDGDYSASTTADDYKAIMDFLNITQTYVFSHDKGAGLATAFAVKYPSLVKRLGVSEYGLPGFGYEDFASPFAASWTLYDNWQIAFFSVPDAAGYFVSGREREMLAWYFWHASYAGDEAVSQAHLDRYATQLSKPGFLRSMLEIFSVATVKADGAFFDSTLRNSPLQMPVLALGGEASFGSLDFIRQLWGPIGANVAVDLVPKAGHWIADENPIWVADRVARFIGEDEGIPSVDLSSLANRVTLPRN